MAPTSEKPKMPILETKRKKMTLSTKRLSRRKKFRQKRQIRREQEAIQEALRKELATPDESEVPSNSTESIIVKMENMNPVPSTSDETNESNAQPEFISTNSSYYTAYSTIFDATTQEVAEELSNFETEEIIVKMEHFNPSSTSTESNVNDVEMSNNNTEESTPSTTATPKKKRPVQRRSRTKKTTTRTKRTSKTQRNSRTQRKPKKPAANPEEDSDGPWVWGTCSRCNHKCLGLP